MNHQGPSGERGRVDAADQHQVREHLAQVVEPGDAVHDHVFGDFAQRIRVLEVGGLGGVQQDDLQMTVDDGAVVQRRQTVAGVHYDHAVANSLGAAGHGRGQRPQPNERGPPGNVHERRGPCSSEHLHLVILHARGLK